eukprot:14891464-Ditylum_brightwellii.AAC.1
MCNSTKAQENPLAISYNKYAGGNIDKCACSESHNLSPCSWLQQQWAKKKSVRQINKDSNKIVLSSRVTPDR